MKKGTWLNIISGLIAIMFFYAVYVQLFNSEQKLSEKLKNVFSENAAGILAWLIPAILIITIILLVYKHTRLIGFWASFSLLVVFNVYLILVMDRVAVDGQLNYGGILDNVGLGWQVALNILFIALAILGIWIERYGAAKNPSKRMRHLWFNKNSDKNLEEKNLNKNVMQG
ncbi:MauE/DoxX family redox-associated membrane protein [Parapedobacter koreensis]|uniref:Methylamine utilisation protein MauE domain-containing protein n=1 Tax=Parapedobacter koreensis TaxID=332977 RepID=A0A1H7FD71_9SPHI|nr:MauE/DoxX family redox-associated membrane protein [Parapedobacter koreensis]SEK24041.1 hypothetical protein SAMN05421740_101313 [Parapedobacter koreensis]